MTKEDIVVAIKALPLEDVATIRVQVNNIFRFKVCEAEAHRQANCPHLRATEGEYYTGLVTWHCPDCGASRKVSHHRERGADE